MHPRELSIFEVTVEINANNNLFFLWILLYFFNVISCQLILFCSSVVFGFCFIKTHSFDVDILHPTANHNSDLLFLRRVICINCYGFYFVYNRFFMHLLNIQTFWHFPIQLIYILCSQHCIIFQVHFRCNFRDQGRNRQLWWWNCLRLYTDWFVLFD